MSQIFISYARDDREVVNSLANKLQGLGYSTWHYEAAMSGGRVDEEIKRAIENAKIALFVWSEVAVERAFVEAEMRYAADKKQLHVKIDAFSETALPLPVIVYDIVDLMPWRLTQSDADLIKLCTQIDTICQAPPSNQSINRGTSTNTPSKPVSTTAYHFHGPTGASINHQTGDTTINMSDLLSRPKSK